MGKKQRLKEQRRKNIKTEIPVVVHSSGHWLWIVPILLAVLFNLNTLQNEYGWDDEVIIKNVKVPDTWAGLFLPVLESSPEKSKANYFRPVVGISYRFDKKLWGEEPFGFHLSVWMAHIINTALVFLLAKAVMRYANKEYPLFPLVVSSLFAVHPVHAEAVAWIAGRNDVFCATFLLASFLLYLYFRQTRRSVYFILSMLAFFLALLTKEAAAGFFMLFPVFEYLVYARNAHGALPGSAGESSTPGGLGRMVLSLFPALLFGIYALVRVTRMASPYGKKTLGQSISSFSLTDGIAGLGYYLKMMVFPYPHNPFVNSLPDSGLFKLFSITALFLLVAGFVYSLIKKDVVLGVGIAWTALVVAPAVAATVLRVAATPVAERYVYAPSAGFLLALCWIVFVGLDKARDFSASSYPLPQIAFYGWAGMVLLFGLQTWNRNSVWSNHLSFWGTTVSVSPKAAFAQRNLGIHYAKVKRYDEAEPHLKEAVALYEAEKGPDSIFVADSLHYLAQLYQRKEFFPEAETLYRRTLAIRDRHHQENALTAATLHNLASLYREQGKNTQAEELYIRTISVRKKVLGAKHPNLGKSLDELGMLYFNQEKYEEAESILEESLRIRENHFGPDHMETAASLNGLAMVYAAKGKGDQAEAYFKRAIRINEMDGTADSALAQILSNLAGLYFSRNDYARAEALSRRVLDLQEKSLGPGHPAIAESLENYAVLLFRLGKKEEADQARLRAVNIRKQQGGMR